MRIDIRSGSPPLGAVDTRLGLAEIAERAGFGGERSLRRHRSRHHGGPPSLVRRA